MGISRFSSNTSGTILLVLCALALTACGGGSSSGGTGNSGTNGTNSGSTTNITCNTAHYTAGAVSVPAASDMASYAKTYNGNTGTFNAGAFTSDGGTATFVLGASGSLSYNGSAQTVNSICKDNTLPMIYVEFNTTGAVDFFADGTFSGNLADASLTGVHNTVSTAAATPTVTGFTPASGAVGTTVTISGTNLGNFTPAPTVKFGTTVATVSSATATSITVTVPHTLATGNSAITLSNFNGTGVVTVGTFNVTAAASVPAAPTGVSATAISASQINLSWSAVSGASAYYVYRATTAGLPVASMTNITSGSALVGPSTVATSLNDTYALSAGTTYYYKVEALNAVGASVASAEVSATTTAAGGGTPVVGLIGGAIQTAPLTLAGTATAYVGSGTLGSLDGTGTAATMGFPTGITTDGTNLYFTDLVYSKVRKIVIATGVVTTIAGTGSPGAVDGTGTAASFWAPKGITTDGTNLYVADSQNGKIRKIVISTGVVTTLAGGGAGTATDGTGTAASFSVPSGITTDGVNLYVADTNNHKIRQIVIATGVVTTLAGSGTLGSTNATGTAASFNQPMGLTTDGTNLYVSDTYNHLIRKIVIATGVVTTLAGATANTGPLVGADGTGTAARFNFPYGISSDGTNLYVADSAYNSIRKIAISTGVVTTLTSGLNVPFGLTTDGISLFATDYNSSTIKKIQ